MDHPRVLGFDVGGTKTAWAVFTDEGKIVKEDSFATPHNKEVFLGMLEKVIKENKVVAVGVGIAGTVSVDHKDVLVCTNIPELSHLQLATYIQEDCGTLVALENDGRCALIGEVWKGAAQDPEFRNCVLLTIGTGVGGAVMQKGVILPHPQDLSKELSRLKVDPSDPFPAPSGAGTLEAFLGGKNIERRLGIDLRDMAERVRKNDQEAVEVWKQISYYFLQSVRAVHMEYNCRTILIGGIGAKDLKFYLQDTPPCPVIAAQLGGKAGMYGAARLALDLWEEESDDSWE